MPSPKFIPQGQVRRCAIGIVGEAGEDTTETAKGEAGSDRNGEQIAGSLMKADMALHRFNCEQTTEECAHNGLSTNQVGRVVQMLEGELWILDPVQKFRSERASRKSGRQGRPSQRIGDGVSAA